MKPVVSKLADRAEISSLVSRYFSAIDDKRLDRPTMETVFTTGGRAVRAQEIPVHAEPAVKPEATPRNPRTPVTV